VDEEAVMDEATKQLKLAQCEERRLRVLRGDGAIGILPVEEIEQMVATYRELAEAGVADAWLGLACYHLDDNGLHPSLEDAVADAARAVALGSIEARSMLVGMLPGFRSEEIDDLPHAADAHRAIDAARADDADGRNHHFAGLLAFHGFGTPRDVEAAFRLHELAAARGDVDAMFELYVLLSTGQGVSKDEAKSLAWCMKAAELGHARACYNLGAFYATGRGVEHDEAKALGWYEKASDAGNGRATATLAYMISQGSACVADPNRAEKLFELAEEQGFDVETFRERVGV
jgi:TPR repeat protein